MHVRFQALLIGLVIFSAAAVAFAVWPGTTRVVRTSGIPSAAVTAKLTNIAAREAAEWTSHPRRATIIATTDAALARFNREYGPSSGTSIYLLVLPAVPFDVLVGAQSVRSPSISPWHPGGDTVFQFRASDLSQMDYSFGVSGDALSKLGPHVDVQLR